MLSINEEWDNFRWSNVIEGRRRGWQKMRWLDGITEAVDLGKLQEISEGQGSLVCCSPWGCEESDTTWWLNNNNMCKIRVPEELEKKRWRGTKLLKKKNNSQHFSKLDENYKPMDPRKHTKTQHSQLGGKKVTKN